ncbi:MAG TPA: hypothetical protein VGJ94_03340 [Syntrophorhabdaceae bacterium]
MEQGRLEAYNEWGELRTALVGIEDQTMEPEWVDALKWLSPEGKQFCLDYGGRKTEEIFPDKAREIRSQLVHSPPPQRHHRIRQRPPLPHLRAKARPVDK